MSGLLYAVAGAAPEAAAGRLYALSGAAEAEPDVEAPRGRLYAVAAVTAEVSAAPVEVSGVAWVDAVGTVRPARMAQVFGGQLVFLDDLP